MSEEAVQADAAAPARASILCVDDEPNILSALRRLFRGAGYQVRVAESGAAGLLMLEAEAADIVISDMRMPEMDGAQFLHQVRQRWPATVRFLLTGHADVNSIIDAINRGEIARYITKPWDEHDIVLLVRHALERQVLEKERARLEALTQRQNQELSALNASLEAKVAARTAALAKANEQLMASYVTSLKVFSTLIEMRGGHLAGHARRVADLARKIAIRLGLDPVMVQGIFVAGLLHEVGKLGFTDELLGTPVASMTARQLQDYRKHPTRGEQLLMPFQDLRATASCIGAQLERADGTGTPKRLTEQDIPIGARVLAVASDYDNLQIGVLVPRKLGLEAARQIIERASGSRYDANVVRAFLDTVDGAPAPEHEPLRAGESVVAARDLVSGRVLTRDLVAPSGLMMLSAGHLLDERLIHKIQDFEKTAGARLTIHVKDLPPPDPLAPSAL